MIKVNNKVKDLDKNLIKLDTMLNEQVVLAMYEVVEFYVPKVIYSDQLNIFDDRQLHLGADLVKLDFKYLDAIN